MTELLASPARRSGRASYRRDRRVPQRSDAPEGVRYRAGLHPRGGRSRVRRCRCPRGVGSGRGGPGVRPAPGGALHALLGERSARRGGRERRWTGHAGRELRLRVQPDPLSVGTRQWGAPASDGDDRRQRALAHRPHADLRRRDALRAPAERRHALPRLRGGVAQRARRNLERRRQARRLCGARRSLHRGAPCCRGRHGCGRSRSLVGTIACSRPRTFRPCPKSRWPARGATSCSTRSS